MGAANKEILFEFEREIYANGDGEDRFVIMSGCLPEDGRMPITAKGNAPAGAFIPGLIYRLWGRERSHDKYGPQIDFSSYLLAQPRSRRGSVRYLMQAPGVGPKVAENLWDAFQSDAITKLRTDPAGCSRAVANLPLKSALKAAKWLEEQAAVESVYVDLYNLLDGRGFPKTVYRKAIERWGNRAADMIRRNPYLLHLLKFPGVGFLKADKLYKELGKNPARTKRQALCGHYAISSDSQGHTWFPAERIKSALREHIDGAEINAVKALKLSVRSKLITVHRDHRGDLWIADARKARNERDIAKAVFDRDDSKCCDWPELDDNKLSESQREQATEAMQGPVAILGGTPGTGKTTTAAAIVRAWARRYGLTSILPLCPTGKAAVRFTEALQRNNLPLRARTIHSALGLYNSEDSVGAFGADEPLPQSLIVLDEGSMPDTDVMALLFRAFGEGSRMLIVGDTNQLTPVGHGAPLRDMIAAKLPYGELTEIWRNSGRIVKACKQLKDTGSFDFSPGLNMQAEDPENLLLCEKWKPEEQIAELEMILNKIKAGGNYDPIWHVQVICAVNAKTGVSRKVLNQRLQGLMNPNGERAGDNPFRVKDKVINTKNGWLPPQNIDDVHPSLLREGRVFVANGEIGEVTAVAPKYTVVELQSPYRVLRIPRGVQEETDSDEEDKTGTGCHWELGYCVSGHKMQGSQAPIVITMIDESPSAQRVMSREWVYTCASRAEKMAIMIGRKRTIMEACSRSQLAERKTFLVERLNESRSVYGGVA